MEVCKWFGPDPGKPSKLPYPRTKDERERRTFSVSDELQKWAGVFQFKSVGSQSLHRRRVRSNMMLMSVAL